VPCIPSLHIPQLEHCRFLKLNVAELIPMFWIFVVLNRAAPPLVPFAYLCSNSNQINDRSRMVEMEVEILEVQYRTSAGCMTRRSVCRPVLVDVMDDCKHESASRISRIQSLFSPCESCD